MVTFTHHGDFSNTKRLLKRAAEAKVLHILEKYGREGVVALSAATPVESGETASSWTYEIKRSGSSFSLSWYNSHVEDGVNIAIILQYGHGTGTGGYVAGRDYINPAIRPILDKLADNVWKEVTAL